MKPSILFLDIETAPDVVWTWGVYQANAIEVKEHWYVLSFAAKWKGQKGIIVKGLDDYKGYKGGNSTEAALLRELWILLDEADIVIAHNGANFDVKKLNARFIDHNFDPPSPYKVIDTKRDLVAVTMYSSNRLNWLSKQFKLGKKTLEHQDFSMWQGCMEGDPKAWRKMKYYNAHDVVLLEKLYNKINPWIAQPNANVYRADGAIVCPNPACGRKALKEYRLSYAQTRVYKQYKCTACGRWARAVNSEKVGARVRSV